MRQYNRAKQRRLDHQCVVEHTINEYEEDRIQARRSNKRKVFWQASESDSGSEADSGRSGKSHGNRPNEFEPRTKRKKRREFGVSIEDGRAHRPGCGIESAAEEIGDAA
jgi:hypothetical protein